MVHLKILDITLGSIVKWLAHRPSTEEILGLNPFDWKFLSSNSVNSSINYCRKTRLQSDGKMVYNCRPKFRFELKSTCVALVVTVTVVGLANNRLALMLSGQRSQTENIPKRSLWNDRRKKTVKRNLFNSYQSQHQRNPDLQRRISEASENLNPEERNIFSSNRDLDELSLHLNINVTIVILCFRHYIYAASEQVNLTNVYLGSHNYPEMFIWFNIEIKRLKMLTLCGVFLHEILAGHFITGNFVISSNCR